MFLSDEELWMKVVGFIPIPKKKILSPFRVDHKPDAFFDWKNGKLKFYDYPAGSDWISITPIQAYANVHHLTWKEAATELNKTTATKTDKQLINKNSSNLENTDTFSKKIIPIKRNWNKEGKLFWESRGVTDFSKFCMIKGFYIETAIYRTFKNTDFTFMYLFDNEEFKLYTPFSENKQYKFLSKCKRNTTWIYKNSDTNLLILKASKDFLIVESLIKEFNLNITIVHLQSEVISHNPTFFPHRNYIDSYKNVFVLLDNDKTGIKNSLLLKLHFEITPLFVNKCFKDFDKMYVQTNREFCLKWLKNKLCL